MLQVRDPSEELPKQTEAERMQRIVRTPAELRMEAEHAEKVMAAVRGHDHGWDNVNRSQETDPRP